MGGRGAAVGALLCALIMKVLGYGLAAMDVRNPAQRLITGCVIVVAVIVLPAPARVRATGSRRKAAAVTAFSAGCRDRGC